MRFQHPNIVKYHGFVKSAETLNIILEYVYLLNIVLSSWAKQLR